MKYQQLHPGFEFGPLSPFPTEITVEPLDSHPYIDQTGISEILLDFTPYAYCYTNLVFGLVGSVFANGPGDLGSIPVRVIPKTLKMVLDIPLLNTQHCNVRIKGKVEQFRERTSALHHISVL